ncbi:perivitellin-2 67 kDa subunit-like [Panonychus citri]|uniref:perivitellin-2 67 kDa subunit-like n=1 Tax=Panonychus citri TaxID=50023 RepID=UPI0023082032|nr:perivitellin-2 67 kDa subunit-like [Panonychus citri]
MKTMFLSLEFQVIIFLSLSEINSIICLENQQETNTESNINRDNLQYSRSDVSSSSHSSSSSGQSSSTSFCENILPGLESVARGVDITKLDLLHDYSVDGFDGTTENLFDYTCRKSRKVTIAGREYDVPDQVQNIKLSEQESFITSLVSSTSSPISLLSSSSSSSSSSVTPMTMTEVRLFEDFRLLKNHLSTSLGLGRSSSKGWFSETLSLSHFQQLMINSSTTLLTMEANSPLYTITLPSKLPLRRHLSEFLSDYLEQELPDSYDTDPTRYLDFLKTYGTHYYRTMTLGGSIKLWSEVSPNIRSGITTNTLQYKAQTLYENLLANFGAVQSSSSTPSENTMDSFQMTLMSVTHARVYGGDTNLYKTKGYQSWKESLMKDPKLISGLLSPITDLVKDNNKRTQLAKAMDIYLALAYLQESKRLLQVYLIILPIKVKENIENLMSRIDKIQDDDTPSYESVKQLLEQL